MSETFPTPTCPCGADQSDGERLYCDDCIDSMAREMADEWGSPDTTCDLGEGQ